MVVLSQEDETQFTGSVNGQEETMMGKKQYLTLTKSPFVYSYIR